MIDAARTLRDELHALIDRLPESQVAPILAIVRESSSVEDGGEEWPLPDFVGALSSGKGDLAARSSEILRTELGREVTRGGGYAIRGRGGRRVVRRIAGSTGALASAAEARRPTHPRS